METNVPLDDIIDAEIIPNKTDDGSPIVLDNSIADSTTITEVAGSGSLSLAQMAEAATPDKLMKKFKERETIMRKDGVMMERDAYYVIPTTAASYPNPEDYAIGIQYGVAKPKGRLFTGKNRKERRTLMANKNKK